MALDPRTQALLGQQLLQGRQTGPVASPLQGAARLANAFIAPRIMQAGVAGQRQQRADDLALAASLIQRRAAGETITPDSLSGFTNQDMAAALAPDLFGARRPPETRERIEGDQLVQEAFNAATGEFEEIGRGSRFKTGTGGTITLVQQANNAEIDQARRQLDILGVNSENLRDFTTETTGTGRPNPNFNPTITRLVNKAIERKVGVDDGFQSINARLFGTGTGTATPDPGGGGTGALQPTPVVAPAVPPPADMIATGAAPDAPLELNTQDLRSAPSVVSPAPAAQPTAQPQTPPGVDAGPSGLGQPQNIPITSAGDLDRARLNTTTIYGPVLIDETTGDTGFVRWTGTTFVPVR